MTRLREHIKGNHYPSESDTLYCGDYKIEIRAYSQLGDGILLTEPDVIYEPNFQKTVELARARLVSLTKIARAKTILIMDEVSRSADVNNNSIELLKAALNQEHYKLGETLKSDIETAISILEKGYAPLKPKQKKSRQPKSGFIYLISNQLGQYKIGLTSKPSQRIETLTVKLPYAVEALHMIKTNDMRVAERQLHDKYANKRASGEWFNLTDEDVKEICAIPEMMFEVES